MISNGDTKKSRERSQLQEPLQKARQDVLREQLLQAELVEEEKVRAETERAEEEAHRLRTKRVSRPTGARSIIDERLDSEDDDYIFLRSYRRAGTDEVRIDPAQGRPEMYERRSFGKAHLHQRRAEPDEVEIKLERDRPKMEQRQVSQEDQGEFRARERHLAFDRELLREQRRAFDIERNQFEEEKKRQHPEGELRRKHGERERDHGLQRRRPEGAHRQREVVQKDRREHVRDIRIHEEPRRRRRRVNE